jgi:hypothetical protein
MLPKAAVVWAGILAFAILNGGLRQSLLIPQMGESWGRIASTFLLCAFVAVAALYATPWMGAKGALEGLKVGLLWTALTLAFEFLAGRYLFGNTWEALLADYNLTKGRLWIFVPLTTLAAPILAARQK